MMDINKCKLISVEHKAFEPESCVIEIDNKTYTFGNITADRRDDEFWRLNAVEVDSQKRIKELSGAITDLRQIISKIKDYAIYGWVRPTMWATMVENDYEWDKSTNGRY